uniref:RNA/RNP complex-1-interacting phosphatase n=1 Tax=Canis lupus familiaris TaxID=9615 RepID=A0A8C0TQE9_CANLF
MRDAAPEPAGSLRARSVRLRGSSVRYVCSPAPGLGLELGRRSLSLPPRAGPTAPAGEQLCSPGVCVVSPSGLFRRRPESGVSGAWKPRTSGIMVKKNSIPDGWRTVTPIGHPVPGTRFIAFKVPLKGAVNQRLTPTQKFTPKDLISAIKALNVELGLIIDLTYTTRYYEVKDLPKSIHYKKLYTVGLEVPDNATILQFKKWVRKFLWENAENGKLIGVHCTNGINRTGYLICRYLIDVEGWDPDTAIQAFGEARGHRINGCVYLKDLKTRPMRSNLGMDVWYSDEDANLPSNSVEDSEDWSPNEDFHGTGKRSRHLNDQHPRNDTQCYGISREETDFNKIQGTRPRPFHDHQCHSGCHEPDAGDDFDFVSKVDGQRRHSIQKHQAYSNCWEQFPTKDFGFTNRSWEQKRQPFSNNREYPLHGDFQDQLLVQSFHFLNRGGGFQRQKPFHQDCFHDEMNLEDLECIDEGSLHDHSNNDFSEKMSLKKYVSRDHGQRPPFPRFQKQTQLRNFDLNSKTGPWQLTSCTHPTNDPQEQILLEDLNFEQETSLPQYFRDSLLPDTINPDGHLDK